MPKTIRVQDPTAPVLQLYKTGDTGKVAGTIAMCTRDKISAATAISWLQTDQSFLQPGESLSRFILQGHVLTLQRNISIQQMQGDWILFIDDDMAWQPDAVKRLVETQRKWGVEMVGGLCFQRGAPYQPTLYMREEPDSGGYSFLEDWKDDDLVEVDATGMAFLLITVPLLKRIAGEFPSYEKRISRRAPAYFRWDERGFGEDLQFCQDVKAAGGSIFVDTSVKIAHVGEVMFTQEDFLAQLATRPQEIEDIRREANDKLGIPTLSRAEAVAKLEALRGAVG